ncbi:P-loop containing nucleoside triphosphate hydrolase protein [Crucibulum laeve]|uniref:RNA helicase n=1 Tax=Crucibulum laeve TaxID=68775 RepID=A0A5C3M1T0_9AGAR|nr:P-loop containing nucleoside triphosphate hydrolase protein [Crucibulum laeve]
MPVTTGKLASKRKIQANTSSARKKVKTHHSANDLPWKTVVRPLEAGIGGDDGILELEEVEGVEIVYEDTENGRIPKFKVVDIVPQEVVKDAVKQDENVMQIDEGELTDEVDETVEETELFDSVNLLPNWHTHSLHPKLLKVLHTKSYLSPTSIQAASIPIAFAGRDIVGVAQTGSGKTLAYGLPILHHLLSKPRPPANKRRSVRALILAPTRELALQVSTHLNVFLTPVETPDSNPTKEGDKIAASLSRGRVKGKGNEEVKAPQVKKQPPHVSVAAIVGGMSAQKQRRILDRGIDILVATPGRLWDNMEDDETLARDIKNLKFLVLDEADRMIEAGHFAELENILRLTLRESKEDQIPTEFDGTSTVEASAAAEEVDTKKGIKEKDDLQTFVFSATLSKDLQRNLKKRFKPKGTKKHFKKTEGPVSTLDDLLLRLDFRDPDPEVIDLSPIGGVVSTLQEGKIECLSADKDVYLYYFLLRYPGRSLVFLSSIDGIRRLMPLIELLEIKAFPLHSQLEQRQRLKNLDRFKNTPNSVLLATDIAARGLDILAVDHVIHFQIPRSADTYIHRNGRTARAERKGFSMLMCAPDERRVVKALLNSVGREESEIAEMSIELSLLDKLKARVQLAKQIENAQHKIKKTNHDRNWMRETAEVLGVDLDSDFDSDPEDENKLSNQKRKAKAAKTAGMKAELKRLISQPLIASGVSTRYITSSSRQIADDLLAGGFNITMVGVKTVEPGSDLVNAKKKKKKQPVKKEEEEEEEWDGIASDS